MDLEELKYKMMSEKKEFKIKLCPKQEEAYKMMVEGKNVFITGAAGCGKTTLIKMFVNYYQSTKKIGVTSTTGISALLFGGTTLHSYLGIGLGTASVEDLSSKIYTRSYLKKRWCSLEVLIIDEERYKDHISRW